MILDTQTDKECKQANPATEKDEILRRNAFPPNNNDQYYELPPAVSAHTRFTEHAVEQVLHSQSVKYAAGPDKLSFGAIRLLGMWEEGSIVRLMRAAIPVGRHQVIWKQASWVVFPKPGKDDDTKLKAYSSISLPSCMGKVGEIVVAEQRSEEAEQSGLQYDGQFRSRMSRLTIDAAAIMVDQAHASWMNGHIPGVLLMDIIAAFSSVVKGKLVNLINVSQMDGNHIHGWRAFSLAEGWRW